MIRGTRAIRAVRAIRVIMVAKSSESLSQSSSDSGLTQVQLDSLSAQSALALDFFSREEV